MTNIFGTQAAPRLASHHLASDLAEKLLPILSNGTFALRWKDNIAKNGDYITVKEFYIPFFIFLDSQEATFIDY